MIAIDADTGKTLWKDQVGDPGLGEFLSGAPLAWNGVVYAGTAGSDGIETGGRLPAGSNFSAGPGLPAPGLAWSCCSS